MTVNSAAQVFVATFPQIIAVLSATLGAVSDGMQYGWTSPVLPVLNGTDSPVTLSGRDHIWLESIYMYGGIAGLPFTIFSVDKIGRRNSVITAGYLSLIAWILMAVATRIEYIYVGRFLAGFAADVAFVAGPIYIAEIADKKIRGFLAGLIYIMMLIGILIIYSVAPFVKFFVPSIIGSILIVFQLVSLPFMPYSPFYLVGKGKEEEAKKSLKRLRNRENVDEELAEIVEAVKRQQTEKGSPLDLIKSKSNRKALIIMIVLNTSQHFSSISVILMNLHGILTAGGSIYLSSNAAGIIFAAMMLVSAVGGDMVIDKFGRKALLICSSVSTGVSLLSIAIYFSFQKSGVDMEAVSWLPTLSVMVYAAAFKFGLGMVPIVLTAELFPARVKAMGITLSDLAYVSSAVLSIEVYQFLVDTYGYDVPFYVFGGSCLFTAIFAYLYIPETKGKSLDEIQFILKGEPYPSTSKQSTKIEELEIGNKEHYITRF